MSTQPNALSYYNPALQLPQYDEQGNPIDPSQQNPALTPMDAAQAQGAPQGIASPDSAAAGFGPPPGSFGAVTNPSAGPGPYSGSVAVPQFDASNLNDINVQEGQNRNYINAAGQQINQEAQGALNYYSPLVSQYGQQAGAALNSLAQTPGYTQPEANQINVDYSKFNTTPAALQSQFLTPEEQQWQAGDPSVGAKVTDQGIANEGAQLGAYQQNLSGQVGNYANYAGQGVSDLKSGLQDANTGLGTGLEGANKSLQSGLTGAQGKFSSLDSAVNNPALAFDPNSTEQQMTDQDVQNIKTAAGQRIGNQYKTAEDTLMRNAAAAGNSSPLAIAAANARLQSQEASDQGNSEANADIAARQAQFQRAQGIEQQREGAVNAQTGFKAGAATTEEKAAQDAAALAGTTGVQSAGLAGTQAIQSAGLAGTQELQTAKDVGQAGINAANQYGTTALGQQNTETGQQYSADTQAEKLAADRAAAIAANRQATQSDVNKTGYAQGTGSQQLTSGGAQKVGDARIAGQNTYLSGVQGQQQLAQQGAQKAVDQQQGAYGTQAQGVNQSTSTLANFDVGAPTAIGQATGLIGALGSAIKKETGGVVTQPEIDIVGERGPELVIPVKTPRYRPADRGIAA